MSAEDIMASELWLKVTVGFRRGWYSRTGTRAASPCYCYWTRIMILTEIKFWPLQHGSTR